MKVEWYFLLLAILTATVMNHASEEVAEMPIKSIFDDIGRGFQKLGDDLGKVKYIDRSLRSRHTPGVHPLRIVGARTHKET